MAFGARRKNGPAITTSAATAPAANEPVRQPDRRAAVATSTTSSGTTNQILTTAAAPNAIPLSTSGRRLIESRAANHASSPTSTQKFPSVSSRNSHSAASEPGHSA